MSKNNIAITSQICRRRVRPIEVRQMTSLPRAG